MKFHPYAEIFPLLSDDELGELAADIKSFGLRESIWLYDGQILDGRNRFLACQKAKIKPTYRPFKGTEQGALALVVSANIHRRQLTEAQRAMAAARIATLKKGERGNAVIPGEKDASRDAFNQEGAAERFDVSRSSVQRARKVIDRGSAALQRAVDAGEVPLKKAAAVTNLPKSEQLAAATRPLEQEEWVPDINEDEILAQAEKEFAVSTDKWLQADDKLAAAQAEIKRQAAEIASLKASRDSYMNRCGDQVRIIKKLRRELERRDGRKGPNGVEAHA